jgi:hypothetical protein
MKAAPMARSFAGPAALAAASLAWSGCGASIQAVYEGDVRFEQCMAMDERPEASAQARRDCWHDWVAYYTYGQTRDRLAHAQLRIRELEGRVPRPAAGAALPPSAVEPRSAPPLQPGAPQGVGPELAPPDKLSAVPRATTGATVETEIEAVRCAGQCQTVHDECSRACTTTLCRKTCSAGFKSCVRSCG